jgi:hypothetical protein
MFHWLVVLSLAECVSITGTVQLLATHDFAQTSNARFEVVLDLDTFDSSSAYVGSFDVDNRRGSTVYHLPASLMERYNLETGDRVQVHGRIFDEAQMSSAQVPFRHTYVHPYFNVTDLTVR